MTGIVIPNNGTIGSASDTDAISIPANGKPTFTAGIANSGTIDAGTLGSSVVFPSPHIIQRITNPTVTNQDTGNKTGTGKSGVCDITGQITITSGNHVLIYCQIFVYAVYGNSNAFGHVGIHQGTIASLGTEIAKINFGSSGGDTYGQASFWGYDSSPADATTPDYCIAIGCGSGNTARVNADFAEAGTFNFFMFEVQQ